MTIDRREIHAGDTHVVSLFAGNLTTSIEDIGVRRTIEVEAHGIYGLWIDETKTGLSVMLFNGDGDQIKIVVHGTDLMDKIRAEVCVSEMHDQEPI